ncbi:phosphatase PAP2 family protein [Haloparvum sedimenti]|uniref:phosphatase PAP2 family protein n=1 Tax=Haloparvum sedimenti TaxID=1678448 RepID=UPI00071E8915|nr:phosphatase PAP2 family protein [Haloparvum sedimenti]
MRSVGEFVVVEALPEVAVVAGAAVTTLADTWFVFGLLALVYWFLPEEYAVAPRRSGGALVALATCALAILTFLKVGFAFPRPPAAATPTPAPGWLPGLAASWFEGTTASDGFGFPSGHATGATITYLGLATLLDRPDRRTRLLAGVGLAVAVALSRVVIEVHYLADVVAGVALGTSVLFGGLWLMRRAGAAVENDATGLADPDPAALDPTPVFLVAALAGVGATAVAAATGHPGSLLDGAVGIGTGLGGALGWRICDGDEPPLTLPVAVPALVVTGALWLGVLAVEPPLPVAVAMATAATAGILAAPAVGERVVNRRGSALDA